MPIWPLVNRYDKVEKKESTKYQTKYITKYNESSSHHLASHISMYLFLLLTTPSTKRQKSIIRQWFVHSLYQHINICLLIFILEIMLIIASVPVHIEYFWQYFLCVSLLFVRLRGSRGQTQTESDVSQRRERENARPARGPRRPGWASWEKGKRCTHEHISHVT